MAPQVIVVIGGLLVLLIAVGVIYKLACGRKKNLYDDEEDDDDEDDSGNSFVNCVLPESNLCQHGIKVYNVGHPLIQFFSFGSSGCQFGCTVAAVSAQRLVEHVKNILLNITNEGMPHSVQPADIGWPTGYGKELSNCHACCLAQLCLAAA